MTPLDDDLEREAFERGRRAAFVQAELDSHEKRLNQINGNIERHAREAGRLRLAIDELSDKIDSVAATIATKAAVERSRDEEFKRANEQQISNRTFWLGVAAILVAIIAAIISRGLLF